MKLLLTILICLSLNGCVWFAGKSVIIGFGKKHVEYYEDGSIKKIELEGNSPLENIVNLTGQK